MLCVPSLSTRMKPNKQRSSSRGTQKLLPLPMISTTLQEEQEKQNSDNFQELGIIERKSERKLSDVWREVQGSNNWNGMLDLMDLLLRFEFIKYGEFAQECYDALDSDPYSSYCGTCKYNPVTMLQDLALSLSHSAYRIKKYLYATYNFNLPNFFKKSRISHKMWSNHANWMGFIAVTEDEEEIKICGRRDIVIVWRGTVTSLEWLANLMDFLKPVGFHSDHPDPRIKVESKFLDLYTACEKKCHFAKIHAGVNT